MGERTESAARMNLFPSDETLPDIGNRKKQRLQPGMISTINLHCETQPSIPKENSKKLQENSFQTLFGPPLAAASGAGPNKKPLPVNPVTGHTLVLILGLICRTNTATLGDREL